jgi:energy-coupling factor transporter ATP-binding protein EcfA2
MIEISDVTKRYGHTVAVDHLSFELRPGEVTGFLGPNRAGKSTTMRIVVGLRSPQAGTNGTYFSAVEAAPSSGRVAMGWSDPLAAVEPADHGGVAVVEEEGGSGVHGADPAISSSMSAKSKTSRFCSTRSRRTDFGIVTTSRWMSHRSNADSGAPWR